VHILLAAAAATSDTITWRGGRGTLVVTSPDWSGSTVALEVTVDGAQWATVETLDGTAISAVGANAHKVFELGAGARVRLSVAAGSPTPAITAYIY